MPIASKRTFLSIVAAAVLAACTVPPAGADEFTPTRFSVEVAGQGPDVIFIPGLASSRDVWSAQAEALAATHRVHLVQVAGFAGDAAPASTDAILPPLVAELDQYIASATDAPPAVIGHSMGGLAGLMLARASRTGRAADGGDTPPFYSALFGPSLTVEMVEPQARGVRTNIAAADDAAFAAMQSAGVARLVKTPERRPEVAAWGAASNRAVFAQAMYEVMTTDMRPDVASLTMPLRVVYAYDASMGPEANVDALFRGGYAAAPNVTFTRIDGSLHFIMLDQPAAFQATVEDFLR
ncbi:MAG: alpha/beta hydrolase [Hyphomonadaceae bacterium]